MVFVCIDLLHNTCFSLGECDVTAGLVRDEFDLDLASLTASLLIVIIIVVGCHGVSWSLDASRIITIKIITRRWIIETGRGIGDVSHDEVSIESIERLVRGWSAKQC